MKKIAAICLAALLLLPLMGIFADAAQVTDDQLAQTQTGTGTPAGDSVYGLDATMALLGADRLFKNVASAFLFERKSQSLMYSWDADKPMYPASLVKIMTALIAVEKGDLEAEVTVTASALSTIPGDAVSVDLVAGETLRLSDLLHCLMVGSANDAAAVIAEYISGTQNDFVSEMNRRAAELGCVNTWFTNPHGLHDEMQLTTARDMARIVNAAVENQDFLPFFNAVRYTVPQTNLSGERPLLSTNHLMNNETMQYYFDERVIGGKTGIAADGSQCIAVSASSNEMDLICVVMGAQSVVADDGYTVTSFGGFKEVSALVDQSSAGYRAAQVLYAGQPLQQCNVYDGVNDVVLGPAVDHTAIIPANAKLEDLDFRYSDVRQMQAPIALGERLSTVAVWYNGVCFTQADLYAMNAVEKVSTQVADTDVDKDKDTLPVIWIVILSIVGVAVAIPVALRIVSQSRGAAQRRRSQKYRKSRRRSR